RVAGRRPEPEARAVPREAPRLGVAAGRGEAGRGHDEAHRPGDVPDGVGAGGGRVVPGVCAHGAPERKPHRTTDVGPVARFTDGRAPGAWASPRGSARRG